MCEEDVILHPDIPTATIKDPDKMYHLIHTIMKSGPYWHKGHLIGVPLAALFTGVNATLSGQAVFRNQYFNKGLTIILKSWGKFLSTQASFPKDNSM